MPKRLQQRQKWLCCAVLHMLALIVLDAVPWIILTKQETSKMQHVTYRYGSGCHALPPALPERPIRPDTVLVLGRKWASICSILYCTAVFVLSHHTEQERNQPTRTKWYSTVRIYGRVLVDVEQKVQVLIQLFRMILLLQFVSCFFFKREAKASNNGFHETMSKLFVN